MQTQGAEPGHHDRAPRRRRPAAGGRRAAGGAGTATTSRRRPRSRRTSRRVGLGSAAHAATDAQRRVVRSRQRRDPARPRDARALRPAVVPPVGPIGPPDDLSNPVPSRPENVADGERSPFNPPAVSIPGPPGLPPSLAQSGSARRNADRKQGVRPGANFHLVDSLERNWEFAADKSGLGGAAGVRHDVVPELQAGDPGADATCSRATRPMGCR